MSSVGYSIWILGILFFSTQSTGALATAVYGFSDSNQCFMNQMLINPAVNSSLDPLSNTICINYCFANNYSYAATHGIVSNLISDTCYCSNNMSSVAGSPSPDCQAQCLNTNSTNCGGNGYKTFYIYDAFITCPSMVSTMQMFDISVGYTASGLNETFILNYNDQTYSSSFNLSTSLTTFSHQYSKSGSYLTILELVPGSSSKLYSAPYQWVTVYSGYYFGSTSIPFSISNPVTSSLTSFVLTNCEIQFFGLLSFIELYATSSGYITISPAKSSFCGLDTTSITCANYFLNVSQNGSVPDSAVTTLYSQSFKVSSGYNLLPFSFIVRPGYFFLVQFGSGKLAINNNNNDVNGYPDYSYSPTQKLNSSANNSVNFYFRVGVIDVPPLINLTCDNTTQLLGVEFSCNLTTYSINQTNQILITFDDGTNMTINLTSNGTSTSGISVPTSSSGFKIANSSVAYLVTNSELDSHAYIDGFEIYAATAGSISLSLITFNFCGQLYGSSTPLSFAKCQDYFANKSNFSSGSPNLVSIGSYNLTAGYNKILLSSQLLYRKGTMIYMQPGNGTVSVVCNTTSDGSLIKYSDYQIDTTNNTVTSLNSMLLPKLANQKCAFQMDLLIQTPIYNGSVRFNKTYTNWTQHVFTMTAEYVGYNVSSVNSSEVIYVWGQWDTWGTWLNCTYIDWFKDNTSTLFYRNGTVDCNSVLSSNESAALISSRNAAKQASLQAISQNVQTQLSNLNTKLATLDTVGNSAGTVTIIFLCVFIAAIVIFDLIGVLAYFKIVKGIKWPKRKKYKDDDDSSDSEAEEQIVYADNKQKNTYSFVYKNINERARHIFKAAELLGFHRFKRPPNTNFIPPKPVKELPSNNTAATKMPISNSFKTNFIFKNLAAENPMNFNQSNELPQKNANEKSRPNPPVAQKRMPPENAVMASKPVYKVLKKPEPVKSVEPKSVKPIEPKSRSMSHPKPLNAAKKSTPSVFDSIQTESGIFNSDSTKTFNEPTVSNNSKKYASSFDKPDLESDISKSSPNTPPVFSTETYSDFITNTMPVRNSYKHKLQARKDLHKNSISMDKSDGQRRVSGRDVDIGLTNRKSLGSLSQID